MQHPVRKYMLSDQRLRERNQSASDPVLLPHKPRRIHITRVEYTKYTNNSFGEKAQFRDKNEAECVRSMISAASRVGDCRSAAWHASEFSVTRNAQTREKNGIVYAHNHRGRRNRRFLR